MNKKAFTSTELLVTLAIIAIMVTISISTYLSWLPKYRLRTSVRQIYNDMNMARSRAISTNKNIGIEFNTLNDTYRVFEDTDEDHIFDAGEPVLSNGTLENDVDITGTTFPNNTYVFNNRGMYAGTTTTDGEVRLTNSSGLFLGVLANFVGYISIIQSTDGGTTWS